MNNDRKWMYRRLQSEFLMNEYCVGVESFVTFALGHPECLLNENIRCPCNQKKCQNKIYLDKDTVKVHLSRYGFVPNYYNWFFHGEEYIHPFYPNLNMDAPSSSSYRVAPRIAQTTFPDFFDTVDVNFEENPENENENFGEENPTINIVPEVPESPKHNVGSKTYSGHCQKSQAMQVHMNEPLTPLDDVTIPSQPTSREVNSMFSMVVSGPKKGRMYGCGSMASTIYPDEMARRPRGGSRSSSRGSQDTERMRAEWEAQKSVNEHLRIDLQATQTTLEVTQHENASLKDRMTILEDQVRRLVAGLPQPQPQPPRRFLYGRGSSSRGRALAGSSHFVDPYAAGSSYRRRWGKVLRYSPEYIPPSQDFGHDDGHGDSDNAYDNDETQSL